MKNIPYAAQWIEHKDIVSVECALKSQYLTQGKRVELFERSVAQYCGAKYAVSVNSGTSALHIACLVAGVKVGDEGITSPITFVASANCLLYCGARPVFADVCDDTICINPVEIEKKINKNSKVVIPVHFAGHPSDMKEIQEIAKKHKLMIIEDAAHALGAEYRGSRIGSCRYSDMTILSFHPVKHITTGEGGMVLTNNKKLYNKLILLRSHGITRDASVLHRNEGPWYYEMHNLGFNYRLTDIQSALGASQLTRLDRFIKRRDQIVSRYNRAFRPYKEISPLGTRPYVKSSHHLYVLRFKSTPLEIFKKLNLFKEYFNAGIRVNMHYIPVYKHPYYRKLGYKEAACPIAEKYYQEAVTLPLYPKMSDLEVDRVIAVTKKIVNRYKTYYE